jgi:hypothetical protein
LSAPAELGRPLGDVLGIIADPLDHADDLQRRDDVAKVAGVRRAERDQPKRALLRLLLERIELAIVLDDLARALEVALHQAAQRLAKRMLGKPAHLADQGSKLVEIAVEGLERVRRHIAFLRRSLCDTIMTEAAGQSARTGLGGERHE